MAELSTQLITPAELTCFEGLKLLEKLLVNGQLVPAWEIKSFLPGAKTFELKRALFISKITNLENAYQFLQKTGAPLCSFEDNVIFGSVLLKEAIEVNCPERVSCLLTLHKTVPLFRCIDFMLGPRLASKHGNVECLRLLLSEESFHKPLFMFEKMAARTVDDDDYVSNDDDYVSNDDDYVSNDDDYVSDDDNGDDDDGYFELIGSRAEISVLNLAAKNGNVECVSLLLSHGLHVDGPGRNHVTPLFVACKHGHVDVVKLLLEAGADIKRLDCNQRNVLPMLLSAGSVDCAKELIKAGVSVNCRGKDGSTPLHIAASNGLAEIATMLIERSADLEAKDFSGSTPLQCAVSRNREELVRILIEAGADCSA